MIGTIRTGVVVLIVAWRIIEYRYHTILARPRVAAVEYTHGTEVTSVR